LKENHVPTAIVTGASSGIGRAAVLKLAARGYHVALAGRTKATLEKAASECAAAGAAGTLAVPTDVSRLDDIENLVRQAHQAFGRIDVLVNNAGYAPLVPTHQVTPEQWREILDTNLSSAFYATRAVWPIMKSQSPRGGVIVNISSMAAKDPFPNLGAYGVAKAGINLLTLATAREGDADNIRVIAIAPGAVDTPMFRSNFGNQFDDSFILQPGNIADAILAAVDGSLQFSSGDTIYIHRKPT
jgi:NAD(P)-dependent dehydrogenase (short-subunit alcohol dehydrogenase family)